MMILASSKFASSRVRSTVRPGDGFVFARRKRDSWSGAVDLGRQLYLTEAKINA